MAVSGRTMAPSNAFRSDANKGDGLAGQLGRQVGLAAIQLHGAMGMTDECRAGHYAKRLLVINQLFGDAAHHLQRLAAQPQC